ncbi:MAG: hypothetical protein R2867_09230 [Caldilineaceae bacterium]
MVNAIADDTRYASNGWGLEPTQVISATRLTLSSTTALTATQVYTMSAVDGSLDSAVEALSLRLQLGRGAAEHYLVRIESQDADGHWGSPLLSTPISPRQPGWWSKRNRHLYKLSICPWW